MASRFLRFVHPARLSPLTPGLITPSTRIVSFAIGSDFDLGSVFDLGSPSKLKFNTASVSYNDGDGDTSQSGDGDASQSGDGGSYYAESEIKDGILEAALEFVPTHGWSREAIVEAAEKYGYPGVAHGMFPGGGADLANYFYARCNSELRHWLKAKAEEEGGTQKVGPFVRDAVEQRIRMTLPYKDTWPQAMVELSSPYGVKGALENLGELVDDIWFYAGDRSVDCNWYSKRGILALVYKTTELHMLQDGSEGHKDTWAFLDRRMADVASLRRSIYQRKEMAAACAESLAGIATTLSNVSGIARK